ncbi:BrnT family toxin [Bounagaea algeriensis]
MRVHASTTTNRRKHGIDFDQAQALWRDPFRIEVPARTVDEPRWLVIGRIDDKCWSAVVTVRQGDIGIISVRRSRDEEVAICEG